MSALRRYLPGVAILISISIVSTVLGQLVPLVSPLLLAVLASMIVANAVDLPERTAPGVGLHTLFLEVGIVLLGAGLTFAELLAVGPIVLALAGAAVLFGIVYVEALSRFVFSVSDKTGALLAAGSSICGVSAVVAVASSIEADERQIAYAVATILLFDALTLFTYPFVGGALGLTDKQFGLWAGLTMFSTGPVAAAGFAYSPLAGQWATIAKVVRNSFIGVAAIGYSLTYARAQTGRTSLRTILTGVPNFLVGFLAVVVLVNVVGISGPQATAIDTISNVFFLLAFAGLGFDIRFREMRRTGVIPIVIVLVHLCTFGLLALLVITRVI